MIEIALLLFNFWSIRKSLLIYPEMKCVISVYRVALVVQGQFLRLLRLKRWIMRQIPFRLRFLYEQTINRRSSNKPVLTQFTTFFEPAIAGLMKCTSLLKAWEAIYRFIRSSFLATIVTAWCWTLSLFKLAVFQAILGSSFVFRTRSSNTSGTDTGIREAIPQYAIDYRTRLLRILRNEVFSLKAQNRCR